MSSRCARGFLLLAFVSTIALAQKHEFQRPEMGSVMRIVCCADDDAKAKAAVDAAFERVEAINRICSDYIPDSELIQLCRTGSATASEDLFNVVTRAQEIAALSDGAFDITVGHMTQLWRRSKRKGALPTQEQLDAAKSLTNWRWIALDPNNRGITLTKPKMQLDLGGIAKGFAADEALKVLKQRGISSAVVAASGDMAIGDPPPREAGWPISLRTFEAPEASDRLITLKLHHCGVSTSGDLHQSVEIVGKRYSHIVDARTGLGLTERIACSVIAPDATTSDAMATALCVLGVDKGLHALRKTPAIQARFATPDGSTVKVSSTEGFPKP